MSPSLNSKCRRRKKKKKKCNENKTSKSAGATRKNNVCVHTTVIVRIVK